MTASDKRRGNVSNESIRMKTLKIKNLLKKLIQLQFFRYLESDRCSELRMKMITGVRSVTIVIKVFEVNEG